MHYLQSIVTVNMLMSFYHWDWRILTRVPASLLAFHITYHSTQAREPNQVSEPGKFSFGPGPDEVTAFRGIPRLKFRQNSWNACYLKFCCDIFTSFISGSRNTIVASYLTVPPLDMMTSPVKAIWPDGHTCIIGPWSKIGTNNAVENGCSNFCPVPD